MSQFIEIFMKFIQISDLGIFSQQWLRQLHLIKTKDRFALKFKKVKKPY